MTTSCKPNPTHSDQARRSFCPIETDADKLTESPSMTDALKNELAWQREETIFEAAKRGDTGAIAELYALLNFLVAFEGDIQLRWTHDENNADDERWVCEDSASIDTLDTHSGANIDHLISHGFCTRNDDGILVVTDAGRALVESDRARRRGLKAAVASNPTASNALSPKPFAYCARMTDATDSLVVTTWQAGSGSDDEAPIPVMSRSETELRGYIFHHGLMDGEYEIVPLYTCQVRGGE